MSLIIDVITRRVRQPLAKLEFGSLGLTQWDNVVTLAVGCVINGVLGQKAVPKHVLAIPMITVSYC